MWTIRQDQLEGLRRATVKRFEDVMVEHWTEFFPAKCQAMGESQLRELIRHGIGRAQVYEITAECEVSVFLDVMLVMGRDFDLQGENAWAVRILKNGDGSNSAERVAELRDAALEHLETQKEANGN
jgi:hypothetical protein